MIMSKRQPNHLLVKIHRSYTVEEISRLFKVHKNTVRLWIKSGLPTCDVRHPMLILGLDLRGYLQARRQQKKRPCKLGELYCMRCRDSKPPALNMAEFHPITVTSGNLRALCPDCGCLMHRGVSRTKLTQEWTNLDITFTQA